MGIVHIPKDDTIGTFTFLLKPEAQKKTYRQNGVYMLRINLAKEDPAKLRKQYIQLKEMVLDVDELDTT